MKKVLIVIPTLGTGGAEKLVVDLYNGFDRNKFDVYLMCLYGRKSIEGVYKDRLKIDNEHFLYIEKRTGLDVKAIFQARKLIKCLKPDIIHSHVDSVSTLILSYTLAAKRYHTVHNIAQEEAKGLQRALRHFAFKFLNVTPIAISDLCKKSIIELYHLKDKNVPVIYNGINCEAYVGRPRSRQNRITIIAVGSFKPQKNYREMLDVFLLLKQFRVNFKALLVGSGELLESIKRKAYLMGLESEIDFIGEVNTVKKYLDAGDVLLSTSNYEGLPISMLEGMANGLPIVATKVGGVPDIVFDGKNGYLYDLGNSSQAAMFIKQIAEQEGLLEYLSKNSLDFSQNFSIKKCVEEHEILYGE